MGKSTKAKPIKAVKPAKTPGIIPDFPKLPKKRPVERVVDKSNIAEGTLRQHLGTEDHPGFPLYQGYSAGVLLDQGFNLSAINLALSGSPQEQHVYIQHPTGRRELLSYTPCK
jgi:hypothetical protein